MNENGVKNRVRELCFDRILPNLASPGRMVHGVLRRLPVRDVHRLVAYDLLPRPEYAYGVYRAAQLARFLDLKRMDAIEFGVAGGRGLIALERVAEILGRAFDLEISVIGFDAGEGLPQPADYRDHPYLWQQGFYRMDADKLRQRLEHARIVLGNVRETLQKNVGQNGINAVGFVSFDLDYYTSTVYALSLFDCPSSTRLPRVFCYFDDVTDPDWADYHEFGGELLAIREFNERHDKVKLGKMQHLSLQRTFPSSWNERMYVLHDFEHPDYVRNVLPESMKQLALRPKTPRAVRGNA